MHLRRQMVLLVREGELSVSEASRRYGVSRNTVREWLRRGAEQGLSEMSERSRRPHRIAVETPDEIVRQIVEFKTGKPAYGAKKIHAVLWPQGAPVSVRTVDRILKREGLVRSRGAGRDGATSRFEMAAPNELWQCDFKGLKKNPGYSPLSLIDDASRFGLRLEPLENHLATSVWETLWDAFGEYGVPVRILFDNEPCFASRDCVGPSWLEARLYLLGVRVSHGRPAHPQTQGKVERFHQTLEEELGPRLIQSSVEEARTVYRAYLREYNYERPHEALGMSVPGKAYLPSSVPRPERPPRHEIPEGAVARKVDASGKFRHQSRSYRAGKGLAGEYVVINEEEDGLAAFFASHRIAALEDLQV